MVSNNFLKKTGWWIISALSLCPVLIWFFILPPDLRFSNVTSSIRSLGDIAGLCGMAMFALVIILSARLKFFERFFNGINDAYTAHHFFGGLAFCLLLFHPLFLAYSYFLTSFNSAALFFLPGDNLARNFGIFGLLLMIITLVITFYTQLKYQVWKYTHKFLGLAFIFAFLHTILVGADLSASYWLKAYFIIFGILAIVAYLYRAVFGRYLVKNFDYNVKNIVWLQDGMFEIELVPNGKEMPYKSGQFAFIRVYNEVLSKEQHPFSISSAPRMPLKFLIKELGDYTKKINSLEIGDRIRVEGPFGNFNFTNYANKYQVWIAGGVGITPFLGMLRSLTLQNANYKINLYYSAKDDTCFSCRKEIEDLCQKFTNLKVIFWDSKNFGFLSAEFIKNHTPEFLNNDILICGPPVMMSSMKKQLLALGASKNKIHSEEFQLY